MKKIRNFKENNNLSLKLLDGIYDAEAGRNLHRPWNSQSLVDTLLHLVKQYVLLWGDCYDVTKLPSLPDVEEVIQMNLT